MSRKSLRCVFEAPIGALKCVDLSSLDPLRYRLIDCIELTQRKVLRIYDTERFPSVPYCAISYVWRGNPADPSSVDEHGTLEVVGAEDGDPISVDAFIHACTASIQHSIDFLWLDRFCILQTSREDKAWQIRRMYDIYKSCALCLILPGGLRRLVSLSERTSWIHRAWTLQEVLVPKTSTVLLRWNRGSVSVKAGENHGEITAVVPGQTAVLPVGIVVDACTMGLLRFGPDNIHSEPAKILDGLKSPALDALGSALDPAIASTDPDAGAHAIWQCALMRTSSRPVDMVFSIMGLFGVSLNPKAFHADDRIGATVALAKEILRQGKSASWLGISFHLPPCRQLSTFPDFPQTSVAGTARIMTHAGPQEVQKLVAVDYPNRAALPVSLPQGTMGDDGYLEFTCKAAPVKALLYSQKHEFPHADISAAFPLLDVKRVLTKRESSKWVPPNGEDGSTFTAADKTVWQLLDKNDASQSASNVPHRFAILLGWFDKYLPGQTAAIDRNIKLMVVEEHAPGRFHAVAGASLHHKLKTQVMQWEEYRFSVGGPEPLQADSSMLKASRYLLQDERTDRSDCEEHSERPARGILPEAFLYKRNAKYDPKKGFYWIEFKNVMVDPQSFTDDPEHLRSELLAWNTWLKPETVVATRYIQPISQPKNNRGAFKIVTVTLRLTGLLHPMEDITTLYEVGLFIHGGRYRLTDFEDQSFVQFD